MKVPILSAAGTGLGLSVALGIAAGLIAALLFDADLVAATIIGFAAFCFVMFTGIAAIRSMIIIGPDQTGKK